MPLKEIPEQIDKELENHSVLLRRLLFNRGILTGKDAENFLNPSYEDHVHDPFLMKNMKEIVDRIYKAIKGNQKICIFADYDCDGIPAAVVMSDLFGSIGYKNFEVYIPDRHKEGYGLNNGALDEIASRNCQLVITLDLGISAVEAVEYGNSLGLEIIITDHHLPQKTLPKAAFILNPKQLGDDYPDNMLCGSGVAFKLAQAFLLTHGEEFNIKRGTDKWMLDMVGLATLADMVPLRNENRSLAYFGLKVLRKTKRPGLLKLFRHINLDPRTLQEDDITFSIVPKLNAASRMDSPMRAYELLSEIDEGQAGAKAMFLSKINDERKTLVATMMKTVKKTLSKSERIDRPIIVIGDPTWRPGVLGLVAGKIVDEYKKPAFVWGLEGGEVIKGSCRSDGSINMVDLMMNLPDGTLLDFGGHSGAGGFSVAHKEIYFLEDRLVEGYEKVEKIALDENNDILIDQKLSLDDVNEKTFNDIDKLAPFGIDNPKPVFLFENVEIVGVKIFGKAKDHLELTFHNSWRGTIKAISFFKSPKDFGDKVVVGGKINLFATIEKSFFGYKKELRLRIIAIN
jgi:single-stranded-DNA-specific exonuclease